MSFWRSTYSGSTWASVVAGMRNDARVRNVTYDDGDVPRLSNAEAVALVEEMRSAARDVGVKVPGWEGLEAIAYLLDFDGKGGAYVDAIQRDGFYPEDHAAALWDYLASVARDMDDADKGTDARVLRPDIDVWPSAYQDVRKSKECRVPIPGVPAKDWPKCKDAVDAIKKKLPPPGQVAPVVPIIGGIKRALPIAIAIIILLALNTDD